MPQHDVRKKFYLLYVIITHNDGDHHSNGTMNGLTNEVVRESLWLKKKKLKKRN